MNGERDEAAIERAYLKWIDAEKKKPYADLRTDACFRAGLLAGAEAERERAAKLCRDKGDKYEDDRDALPTSPAADTLNTKAIACWECEEEIRGTVEGG